LLNQLEKSISADALKIYSLRENQLSALISNLNIYLKDFDLPFKIDTKLIDKFYTNNLKSEDYEEKLKNNRKIDTLFGGCAIGPHKSDYIFCVNDNSLVSQLSTGQQKTIILLMYLSQCKYLYEVKFKKPILLLDEVCSHLDDINRNVLLTLIETFKLQIFMTGTSENLFSFLSTNANFCNITD
jgi:DNA replication and repair protein RecF